MADKIRAALAGALRTLPPDELIELVQHVADDALIAAAWKAAEGGAESVKKPKRPHRPPRVNASAAMSNGGYQPRSEVGVQVLAIVRQYGPVTLREVMSELKIETTEKIVRQQLLRCTKKGAIRRSADMNGIATWSS